MIDHYADDFSDKELTDLEIQAGYDGQVVMSRRVFTALIYQARECNRMLDDQ